MNRINIAALLLITFCSVFAQNKSVKVKFKYPKKEQTIINQLNDIQMVTAVVRNRKAKGKMFIVDIVEYEKGKIVSTKTTGADCDITSTPVRLANGDTAYYIYEPCRGITFKKTQLKFPITFGGKRSDSAIHLLVNYPYQTTTFSLKGKPNDLLQPAFNSESTRIKLNTKTPLLLYFGGYKSGNGVYYCLAKTAKAEDLYQSFGVEHYYVIHLTIK